MTNYYNDSATKRKCHNDKTPQGQNATLTKCHNDKMLKWQKISMASWQNTNNLAKNFKAGNI